MLFCYYLGTVILWLNKVINSYTFLSDSLYEEEDDLDEEGEEGSGYLDSGLPRIGAPETNNNLSPGSPAVSAPLDKSPSHQQQADSSTERDPNDSEGEQFWIRKNSSQVKK